MVFWRRGVLWRFGKQPFGTMCLSIQVSDGTLGTFFAATVGLFVLQCHGVLALNLFFAATLGLSVLQWHGVLAAGGALGLWQAALWNNCSSLFGFQKGR